MARKHYTEKSDVCEHKVLFSVTHSVMLLLQKSTNLQTHEIMSILVEEYENIVEEYELNLNKKSAVKRVEYWGRGNGEWQSKEQRVKRHITFPNTDITLSCNLSIWWHGDSGYELRPSAYVKNEKNTLLEYKANTNIVKFNVIMPQSKLYFNSEQLGEMMLEGDIFDASEDIDELKKKDTLTPAEKREREEQKKKEKQDKFLAKIRDKQANNKKLSNKEKGFLKTLEETQTESIVS